MLYTLGEIKMLVIGITGGTGCGKTTLLKELEAAGGCAIDCDALYHELLKTSKEMLSEIGNEFPGAIAGGELNRKALGKIVFEDEESLLRLNSITHRYVGLKVESILKKAKQEGKRLAGIDAIALIESGISERCAVTVGVIAERERRIARIMGREGISREYAALRADAQKNDDYFRRSCDYILENNFDTEAEFRIECRKLLSIILKGEGENEYL